MNKRGLTYAVLAYLCWGLFPLFWKLLKEIPSVEIFAHRILWAFLFYTIVVIVLEKKWFWFRELTRKQMGLLCLSSLLLMTNWILFIYAVNSNQIVETSLGYFINPLVNMMIGVWFLNEKMKRSQKIAAFLAAVGVMIITFSQAGFPWIAITLAITFSVYGFIKKKVSLSGLHTNQIESLIFAPVALIYLMMIPHPWMASDNHLQLILILMSSGIVTGVPLILFAEAAQLIPYYVMGFLQFITPTMQFLTGVLLYNELLTATKFTGFIFIWAAVGILLGSTVLKNR